jgi:hypothetical protein
MSKTNNVSNLATLEDYHPLTDSELDAVTGGLGFGMFSWMYPTSPNNYCIPAEGNGEVLTVHACPPA